MNGDDLEATIRATMLRHHGRWRTQSGAFLDVLREFAREEKIGEIANACQIYFESHRGAQSFVASALPEIIINNYKPLTAGVEYSSFLAWAEQNPDWADQIRDHARSPRLASVIHELKVSLQKF